MRLCSRYFLNQGLEAKTRPASPSGPSRKEGRHEFFLRSLSRSANDRSVKAVRARCLVDEIRKPSKVRLSRSGRLRREELFTVNEDL